jgi:hypothetical protein
MPVSDSLALDKTALPANFSATQRFCQWRAAPPKCNGRQLVSEIDMVGAFQKAVAFSAAKLSSINGYWAKPDLDIPWKQFIGNSGAGLQLGQELTDFSSACGQFNRCNPCPFLIAFAANEQVVTMRLVSVNRGGLVFKTDKY